LQMVIFDFDGVIADTEPAHFETLRQILNQEGIDLNWQQYCDKYMAFDDRDCFIHALKQSGSELDRKVLADMAVSQPEMFDQLVKEVKNRVQ